jgi:hypothetical protein
MAAASGAPSASTTTEGPPAGWHALPPELLVRILTRAGVGGAELSRCATACAAWRGVELQHRAMLWQAACARHGMQQVGTRRRGWQCWRALFISQCCVECAVPAAHVFNLGTATTPPGVLRWAGRRVALCERCCACFHDFPRTRLRWQRRGLQVRVCPRACAPAPELGCGCGCCAAPSLSRSLRRSDRRTITCTATSARLCASERGSKAFTSACRGLGPRPRRRIRAAAEAPNGPGGRQSPRQPLT